jgi:hypothetical protein
MATQLNCEKNESEGDFLLSRERIFDRKRKIELKMQHQERRLRIYENIPRWND